MLCLVAAPVPAYKLYYIRSTAMNVQLNIAPWAAQVVVFKVVEENITHMIWGAEVQANVWIEK